MMSRLAVVPMVLAALVALLISIIAVAPSLGTGTVKGEPSIARKVPANPADGVCAASMRAYQTVINLPSSETPPAHHFKQEALAKVQAESPWAARGTRDAYFGVMSGGGGSSTLSDLPVWVVEINGLELPSSGPMAVSSRPETVTIHHTIFVLSDTDLHIATAFMCP